MSIRTNYRRLSPLFASLEARYGRTMPLAAAERLAAQHGATLRGLTDDEGLTVGETVDPLDLVLALGY